MTRARVAGATALDGGRDAVPGGPGATAKRGPVSATRPTGRALRPGRGVLATALLLSALGGCRSIEPLRPDAAPPEPQPSGASCPPGSTLRYETFAAPFFDTYCQRCHASSVVGGARQGAPSNRTYDDRESVLRWLDEIDANAAAGHASINRVMPPSEPRPSDAERQALGEWIACGAP